MVDQRNHLPSAQHEPGTVAQHEPGRVHSTSGRLEPEMWAAVEDTDPAMVLDVERGAAIDSVPPVGFIS